MARQYWLLKTEPTSYSINDLQRDGKTGWDGVRNYQARNTLRDEMKIGDEVFIYHSNGDPPGIAGRGKITGPATPDPTAFDPNDSHYDPKSKRDAPTWFQVEVSFVAKFPRLIGLDELKVNPHLAGMVVLQRGSRLSVQPVSKAHFDVIVKLAQKK